MSEILTRIDNLVWGLPLILLLLGTGIYFTLSLHGLQFTRLKLAFQ